MLVDDVRNMDDVTTSGGISNDISWNRNSSHASYGNHATAGSYDNVKNFLQVYVVPVIILTGFIGNTLSFLVFVSSPLKRISTSVYIAALSFSDTGFLFCLGVGWLESLGIRFFHTNGICQMTVYTSFVFGFTSIWTVNAFTTEMYVAVFHPRKSLKVCTPKSARRVMIALSVVAALIYVYVFWLAKVVRVPNSDMEMCLIVPEDANSVMIFSYFDTVITLVVPFTMIIFMITRLLLHISQFYREELESSTASDTQTMDTNSNTPSGPSHTQNPSANPTVRQATEAQAKLTRMLVVTVLVFLVLNLPSHAIKVQFLFRSHFSESVQFTETEGLMQVIFQMLYYANFSINFVLYSACAKSFRHALCKLPGVLCSNGHISKWLCPGPLRQLALKTKLIRDPDEMAQNVERQPHSRLVDIHLGEIHFSQLPSMESQFVYQSPPCLLRPDESEQLLEVDSLPH